MRAIPVSRPKYLSAAVRSILIPAITCLLTLCPSILSQEASPQVAATPRPLITQSVDDSQLTTLRGNTHPLARPEFDLGTAPASLPMKRMLLVLRRNPDQEAILQRLLDDQQDKVSPNYHKWLSPEQFGQQFGPTDADVETVTTWLQSHGFEVSATKGRTVLEFSGSTSQVQEAFHTSIHKYIVNGEQHWANATDPQIPTALAPVVAGMASLNNFPRRAMNAPAGAFSREKATGKFQAVQAQFTFPSGCVENSQSSNSCAYAVGPYDFATIYDVLPLWSGGVNGTGQTIAIVGETNINIQDVADFRSMFGLPVNNPTIILNGPDPGIQGDESEADIDVQWSGAVAPNATIDFVVSQSTETTAGVDLSAVYIVENNLAPVMSESYGYCELGLGTSGNQFYNALWQQAAAQGITVFISSGDNGAAGCDDFNAASPAPAQFGLQVSGFASTPYNVAVGGTDFNDFSNPATYWSTTNNSTTQASALSYIPETTWNDSCTNAIFASVGYSTNAETNCNDSRLSQSYVIPEGGSGGVSNCTTPSGSSCAGGYAKPSWQAGKGVPADGKRDIPDVSLFASNGFLGSFYIICQRDQTYGSCSLNNPYSYFLGFGGTSVASPAFAGIMALVNQQTGSRQGNANYVFYKLAAQQPTAFHDVTSGTIAMPCATGSPNCTTTRSGDAYGVLSGYSAGTGYDLATGLGSVDANNLVTKWTSISLLPSATIVNSLTPATITHGQPVTFNISVKPASGTGSAPTGLVSLEGGPTNSKQGIAGFTLSNGTAAGSTDLLPGGTYSLIAHYPGDSTYGPSDSAPVSVTVSKENSQTQAFLVTFDSNGNIVNNNANTAVYASPYLLRVNVENSAGQLCAPVGTSGATGCPSGSVTLTDNGSPFDGGTFTLSSYGYFEDQSIQLTGGSHSLKAAYAGDDSFNSSSLTNAITITPASTSMSQPYIYGGAVGQSATMSTYVNTTSSGAAPSGTVTFYANGTALTGTTAYSPRGGGPGYSAYLQATFTSDTNAFPSAGTYSITASYQGDANYSASTSGTNSISVKYPKPGMTLQPSSFSFSSGTPITLTALVISMSKTVAPTGTISFTSAAGQFAVPVSYSTVVDQNGNLELQGVITVTPTFSDSFSATYSGDTNYPGAFGGTGLVTVVGNDFTLSFPQTSVTVIRGGYTQFNMFVGMQNGTNQVTFSATPCSGMPAESTCTANLASVPYTLMDQVNLSATAPHSSAKRSPGLPASARWIAPTVMLFGGVLILSTASPRRRLWSKLLVLHVVMLLMLLMMIPSCGGGSGGGGGSTGTTSGGGGGGGGTPSDPGTPAGSYTVTITATSGSISHSATFTLTVQ